MSIMNELSRTSIVYHNPKQYPEWLQDWMLNIANNVELLSELRQFLIDENADVEGDNEQKIKVISEILDNEYA